MRSFRLLQDARFFEGVFHEIFFHKDLWSSDADFLFLQNLKWVQIGIDIRQA